MELNIKLQNLFLATRSLKVVQQTGSPGVAIDESGNQYSSAEFVPIPLNYWWLKIFGFEVVSAPNEGYCLVDETGYSFNIFRDRDGNWVYYSGTKKKVIQYVHELQQEYLQACKEPHLV